MPVDLTRVQALCLSLVAERTRATRDDRTNARAADHAATLARQAGASDADIQRAIARGWEA